MVLNKPSLLNFPKEGSILDIILLNSSLLLCSWGKSLNIGSCLFCKFSTKFIWLLKQIRCYSFYILIIEHKSFIFLMMLWIIYLCVYYNQRGKGIIVKSSLNKFPRNWFLHDMISWERLDAQHVSNHWLHTVQTVICKGVNFEETSQQTTSNIQALISTTQ